MATTPAAGFIAALDRATGKLVWRQPRATYHFGNYGSPVVAKLAGRPQLLLAGLGHTSSYDPVTGAPLWSCQGPSDQTANTVTFADPCVFSAGGHPQLNLLCVRADGSGDVTGTHVLWQTSQTVPNISSPLVYRGQIYVVTDNGIFACLDAASGKTHWKQRLRAGVLASPVAAGNCIYLPTRSGMTYVFEDACQAVLLAENQLDGSISASPAICGGQVFLRTDKALYCIGP